MKKIAHWIITVVASSILYSGIICLASLHQTYMHIEKIYASSNSMIIWGLRDILYYFLVLWLLLCLERKYLESIYTDNRIMVITGIVVSFLCGKIVYFILDRVVLFPIIFK